MNIKRTLIILMFTASIFGSATKEPETIIPFNLTYDDVADILPINDLKGRVIVQFTVDENGRVVKPQILNTFSDELSETILKRVLAIEFNPALQNGKPIQVKYHLPILFE